MQGNSDFWNRHIDITGLIRHSLYWPFASDLDQRYPNPRFKKFPTNDAALFNGEVAIYCLHGIGDSSASFRWFTERAIDQLHPCVSSINIISLNNTMTTFQQDAELVLKKILANNDRNVIFIGHSKGAVDSAVLSEKLAKQAGVNVHAVMAITAPFQGSKLALWPITTISPPVKQLELGSPDLRDLVDAIKTSKTPYYYYATGRDGFLETDSCIIKENCARFRLYPEHGHTSIMSSLELSLDLIPDLSEACANIIEKYCPLATLPKLRFVAANPEENKILIACTEIESEVIKIKKRTHLKSALNKVYILARLNFLLSELLNPEAFNPYPTSVDISDFLSQFLHDTHVMYGENKPLDVLNSALNFPFLNISKTKSMVFLDGFLKQHGKTMLPKKIKPTLRPSQI